MNRLPFDKGLKIRREVLGAEHVGAAISNADDFSMEMRRLSHRARRVQEMGI